jgi:hypothetical protein
MFSIDQDARKYIQKKSGAIVVSMNLEPAIGG